MIDNVLAILAGLGGLGSLISMLVNVLKTINVVKDGTSQQWVQGLNLLAFVVVSVVYLFNVQVNWDTVNVMIGFCVTLLGFVVQLFASKATYSVTKGLPVVGYSHSDTQPKE